MRGAVLNLGFALGVLVAVFGLTVDFIMPGASPGLNLPQILIIVAGVLLAYGSRRLRRDGLPSWSGEARKQLARGFAVTIVTLLALEIALTAFGAPTFYPTELSDAPLERAPWWACDELGCRFVQDAIVSACDTGEMRKRECIVNRQGFADSDEFIVDERADGRQRILMLGDSFTQGYTADVGASFVETLEADLPDALVWNAGIGGTGTNQAVVTFSGLGPLFKPRLTILGFFTGNDFRDNLFPLDSRIRFTNADGSIEAVRFYVLDQDSNPVRLELTAGLVEYARAGKLPIPNEFERLLGNTRLGSLLLQMKQRIDGITVPGDPHFARATELTRKYLSALKSDVSAAGSEFLVLVIPSRTDVPPPKMRYETLIEILHELDIAYLDPEGIIQAPGDFAAFPDVHWNSSGHQKVGALLSECIKAFNDSGSFADCRHVTVPNGR